MDLDAALGNNANGASRGYLPHSGPRPFIHAGSWTTEEVVTQVLNKSYRGVDYMIDSYVDDQGSCSKSPLSVFSHSFSGSDSLVGLRGGSGAPALWQPSRVACCGESHSQV